MEPKPSDTQPVPAEISPASEPAQPNNLNPVAPTKKKMPLWLKIFLIILAIIVIFFIAILILAIIVTKNAVKVSNQMVADIQSENINAAYSLTSPDFKKINTSQALGRVIDQVSPALQGKVKIVGNAIKTASGHPDEAIIIYAVDTTKGTKYIRVVLEDNHPWQVQNFRSSDTPLTTSADN